MENQEKKIILKKKKPSFLEKVNNLFKDKKKRPLFVFLFILPFLIAIGVFGFVTYKEAKSLIALAKSDDVAEVVDDHKIESMGYVLRDNATDVQFEYFTELKNAVESGTSDAATETGLVCKNFVADFFTWTNKSGQYDVGGLYYVYDGEQEETGEYKTLLYTDIRDHFYKYLNEYIDTYGSEDLLEVETCTVVSATKSSVDYGINEKTGIGGNDTDGYYAIYEGLTFDTYLVKCTWTYKETTNFDTSKYPTEMNFAVVYRNNRFEIVEATGGTINVEDF